MLAYRRVCPSWRWLQLWLLVCLAVAGCGRPQQTAPTPPPQPASGGQTGVSEYVFAPVTFSGSDKEHRSHWILRTSVTLERTEQGIKCQVRGTSGGQGGQYGGIKFAVSRPRALRLTLSFVNPQNIQYVYVDGYGHDPKKALVRWTWDTSLQALPSDAAAYTLLPKQGSGGFSSTWVTNMGGVKEFHVFIKIKPGTEAGFVVHKAEVAGR